MRLKCDNADYVRDESSGALILINQDKVSLAKENESLRDDINKLREEIQSIKKLIGVES